MSPKLHKLCSIIDVCIESFLVNALALERRYQKKEKKKQIEAGKGVLKGLIIIKMVINTILYRLLGIGDGCRFIFVTNITFSPTSQ